MNIDQARMAAFFAQWDIGQKNDGVFIVTDPDGNVYESVNDLPPHIRSNVKRYAND